MKIGIIGSMQFTEKMLEICDELNKIGHKNKNKYSNHSC